MKENFWLCTISRAVVLQVRDSCAVEHAQPVLQSFTTWTEILPESFIFQYWKETAFILQNLKMLIIPFLNFFFFLNSAETAGTAEADPCSRGGPRGHYGQQHGNHCLSATEGCGGPFSRPGPHWNQSSTYYKSGLSSYSDIPTEQEFPSDFCYLG